MVEEAVGRVAAAAALGADELAVAGGLGCELEQALAQARFFGQ